MRDRVMTLLIATSRSLTLAEIQRDAGRGAMELIGEVAIVALDDGDEVPKLVNEGKGNRVGDEHVRVLL